MGEQLTQKIRHITEFDKKHFFFVRHAETDWNRLNLCQGQRDIPLNQEGIQNAKEFATSTLNLTFDCIVSSPLLRALQTAKELQSLHKKAPIHLMPGLGERNWGKLEGISSSEMYAIEEKENKDPSYVPGHQVEPRKAFQKRISEAITYVQALYEHPLIVSHGRVFMELCHLLRVPAIQQIPNCQLAKITPNKEGWEIHLF